MGNDSCGRRAGQRQLILAELKRTSRFIDLIRGADWNCPRRGCRRTVRRDASKLAGLGLYGNTTYSRRGAEDEMAI